MLATLAAGILFVPLAPLEPAITRDELVRHLRALTDPKMEGRLTLQPGERLAAEYLAADFRRLGLVQGPHEDFIHRFDIAVNSRATRNNAMSIEGNGRRVNLELGKDFVPVVGSAPMRLNRAPLTYVGFGIKSESWDDFRNVNLRGRVAVMLRGAPTGKTPVPTPAQKARWAHEQGATGVVFVGPEAEGNSELPRPTRHAGVPAELNLTAVGLHRRHFRTLTGLDWRQARESKTPLSRNLPFEVRKVTEVEPHRGQGMNVVGFLPGTDPKLKDEYIIIGAHFDHLGWGEVGSRTRAERIHPGADDNASGVAGVLALAEYFAHHNLNRRTLVFQLYSGEEVGLVGARLWVRDNPAIIGKTTAMINMDMIGRVRNNRLTIFSTSSSTEWPAILGAVKVPPLEIAQVPSVAPNSDHFPFAQAQVPVLFYHSNLTEEYHTERDTVETLNIDGMVQVLEHVKGTIKQIDARDKLAWNPQAVMGGRGGAARRVRIGFQPDMTASTGPGVALQGVSTGSPAEKAGLKAGDRVLSLAGREVKTLEDLQAIMASLTAGRTVVVIVQRGDQRLELNLTPEAPAGS